MKSKFLVLKMEDILSYLTYKQNEDLSAICQTIHDGRQRNGKNTDRSYVVINTDELYADQIAKILKENGHWG